MQPSFDAGVSDGADAQLPFVQTSVPGQSVLNEHELLDVHAAEPPPLPTLGASGIVEVCSLPSELNHSLWLLCMHPTENKTRATTARMPVALHRACPAETARSRALDGSV